MREEKIKVAKDLIKKLYDSPDGGVGGYAHIVTDDYNTETHNVIWCLKEAIKGESDYIGEITRQASIDVLIQLLTMKKSERNKACKHENETT